MYPKAKFSRKPNLAESRISPNAECSEVPKFLEVWIEHTTL